MPYNAAAFLPGRPQSLPGMQNLQGAVQNLGMMRHRRARMLQDWETMMAQNRAAMERAQLAQAGATARNQATIDAQNYRDRRGKVLDLQGKIRGAYATGNPEEVLRFRDELKALGGDVEYEAKEPPPELRRMQDDAAGPRSMLETELDENLEAERQRDLAAWREGAGGRLRIMYPELGTRTWDPRRVQAEREVLEAKAQERREAAGPATGPFGDIYDAEYKRAVAELGQTPGLSDPEIQDRAHKMADAARRAAANIEAGRQRGRQFGVGEGRRQEQVILNELARFKGERKLNEKRRGIVHLEEAALHLANSENPTLDDFLQLKFVDALVPGVPSNQDLKMAIGVGKAGLIEKVKGYISNNLMGKEKMTKAERAYMVSAIEQMLAGAKVEIARDEAAFNDEFMGDLGARWDDKDPGARHRRAQHRAMFGGFTESAPSKRLEGF